MANPITGAIGHVLTGVVQLSARTSAPGPTGSRAPAAPSTRVTRSMAAAALTEPLPAYVPVQDDDHDVQSGAARPRFSSLGLSNTHPFQYTTASIPYPPTAPYLKTPPEGIEAVFGPSVKYYDMKLTPAQAPNTLDRFEIFPYPIRQSTRAASLNKYHTEHVFEIHFVKDFLVWAVNNKVTTLDGLEHLFFQSTEVDSSNGINRLLRNLSWWDTEKASPVDPTGPRYEEFFVLEAQLNLLKGQILFSGDTAQARRQFFPITMPAGQPLANSGGTVQRYLDPTWQQLYRMLRDVALVFQYMNLPKVRKVFLQVYNRFVAYFQSLGNPWPAAFQTWMKAFLAGRQAAIAGYYSQTLHQIQITLVDMATHAADLAERSALQQTWREISGQLPPASVQFHSDYPH